MSRIDDVLEEFQFHETMDEKWMLMLELGRELEPMPDALKNDETRVKGCISSVWTYPSVLDDGRLHFLADSNSDLTKGIIALVLMTIQDRTPTEICSTKIEEILAPFNLGKHFTSNRTQGIPNMIALIRATAARYAA